MKKDINIFLYKEEGEIDKEGEICWLDIKREWVNDWKTWSTKNWWNNK